MTTPDSEQFKQLELFDGSEYDDYSYQNDPGLRSFDDWLESPGPSDDEVQSLGGRVGDKIDSTLESNFGNLGIMWPYMD